MPRSGRLHIHGGYYHVMGRGLSSCRAFVDVTRYSLSIDRNASGATILLIPHPYIYGNGPPMKLKKLLETHDTILAEGSIYELLRRHPAVQFDPDIAHAGLIYTRDSRVILENAYKAYLDVGQKYDLPMVTTTATWRASKQRLAQSGFKDRSVNQDNVRFLMDLCGSYKNNEMLVGGNIGPMGDAYRPDQALSRHTAREFHRQQIDSLVEARPDFLQASTLPAFTEAAGIADAMADTGMCYILSFVILENGSLLDGTPLSTAISNIDDTVSRAPIGYAINCVHPDTACSGLKAEISGLKNRIIGFFGNTSARTPEELDGLAALETEDPELFSCSIENLTRQFSIPVVGGCCGTDHTHIEFIAARLTKQKATTQ